MKVVLFSIYVYMPWRCSPFPLDERGNSPPMKEFIRGVVVPCERQLRTVACLNVEL